LRKQESAEADSCARSRGCGCAARAGRAVLVPRAPIGRSRSARGWSLRSGCAAR